MMVMICPFCGHPISFPSHHLLFLRYPPEVRPEEWHRCGDFYPYS